MRRRVKHAPLVEPLWRCSPSYDQVAVRFETSLAPLRSKSSCSRTS